MAGRRARSQSAVFSVGAGGGAHHGTTNLAFDDLEVNDPLDAAGAHIELGAGSTVAVVGWCSNGAATDITVNTTFSTLSAAPTGQSLVS